MSTPIKHRVTTVYAPRPVGLLSTGRHAAPDVPATVQILDTQPGSVTTLDRIKAYYKGLIVFIGGLASVLTGLTLPAPADRWVPVIITALTITGTILKANETWVEDL